MRGNNRACGEMSSEQSPAAPKRARAPPLVGLVDKEATLGGSVYMDQIRLAMIQTHLHPNKDEGLLLGEKQEGRMRLLPLNKAFAHVDKIFLSEENLFMMRLGLIVVS